MQITTVLLITRTNFKLKVFSANGNPSSSVSRLVDKRPIHSAPTMIETMGSVHVCTKLFKRKKILLKKKQFL